MERSYARRGEKDAATVVGAVVGSARSDMEQEKKRRRRGQEKERKKIKREERERERKVSRRERRKGNETRRLILNAFLKVFNKNKPHARTASPHTHLMDIIRASAGL